MKLIAQVFVIFLTVTMSIPAHSENIVGGKLALLTTCPGDITEKVAGKQDQQDEILPFFAALLTPLLTGVVNQGLKAAGSKLTESANKQNIDVLHAGDHFYYWPDNADNQSQEPVWKNKPRLHHACLIVVSKGTMKPGKKRKLEDITKGYKSVNFTPDPITQVLNEEALKIWLEAQKNGYSDLKIPGLIAVFDVELSEQKTEARLIPRFVMMDHSIREKKKDTNRRTMTFEFDFSIPGQDKSFGKPILILANIRIGTALVQDQNSQITSTWYTLPEIPKSSSDLVSTLKESTQQRKVEIQTALLAGKIARWKGDKNIPVPDDGDPFCTPNSAEVSANIIEEGAILAKELEKKTNKDPNHKVLRYTNSLLYYQSCKKQHALGLKLVNTREQFTSLTRSFDATVTVKEFRERSFEKFWGAVLSDDAMRTGLTSAIVGQVDPATRAAREKTEETANIAAWEAYDTAMVTARNAEITYLSATATEKPTKYIDMEAKKRAANRKALSLSISLPFPESGLWYGVDSG